MALPIIASGLWTAAKGACLCTMATVGLELVTEIPNDPVDKLIVRITVAIAGAAFALLSLVIGTAPFLGAVIGMGLFLILNGGKEHDDENIKRAAFGCALIGFVAGAILGPFIAPAAVLI